MIQLADSNSFKANKRFFDDKRFPRGFARSGQFTIKEAQLLETYGVALNELSHGHRAPATEEEQRFVKVVQGQMDSMLPLEKVWMKYLRQINQPKKFYGLTSAKPVATAEADPEAEV